MCDRRARLNLSETWIHSLMSAPRAGNVCVCVLNGVRLRSVCVCFLSQRSANGQTTQMKPGAQTWKTTEKPVSTFHDQPLQCSGHTICVLLWEPSLHKEQTCQMRFLLRQKLWIHFLFKLDPVLKDKPASVYKMTKITPHCRVLFSF